MVPRNSKSREFGDKLSSFRALQSFPVIIGSSVSNEKRIAKTARQDKKQHGVKRMITVDCCVIDRSFTPISQYYGGP